MHNIQLNGTDLIFHKKIWDEQDIFLAQCLWAKIGEDNTITFDLRSTFKKGVASFMKTAFPSFVNNKLYATEKEAMKKDIRNAYQKIFDYYELTVATSIPHWDKLYQHQKDALVAMHCRRASLLAFQQRTGKSIIAGTFSKAIGAKRTVIVCYDVGKYGYLYDLTDKKWNAFDQFDFTILDSSRRKCIKAFQEKFVIINYEAMPKYMDYLIENPGTHTDHIILDECQKVKSVQSRNFKLCKQLIESCPDARITLMSGTPVMNRIDDMFAYLKIVGHPLGKNRAEFDRQYIVRTGTRNKVTGARNLDRLYDYTSNLMLRKRLDECVDVPEKAHIRLYYPLGEWREEYMKAIQDALENKGGFNEGAIHSVNSVMACAKVESTMEQVRLLVEEEEKVVLFTSYTTPLDMIEKILKEENIGYVRIDGKSDGKQKADMARKFNEDKECMVAICNITAAGHSISLAEANYMIFLNQPLTPAAISQCLFRDMNLQKTKKTTVYYAVCTGEENEITVDQKLTDLNLSKLSDINTLIDGGKVDEPMESATEILFESMMKQYGKKETV